MEEEGSFANSSSRRLGCGSKGIQVSVYVCLCWVDTESVLADELAVVGQHTLVDA